MPDNNQRMPDNNEDGYNLFNTDFPWGRYFTERILDNIIWALILGLCFVAWDLYGPKGMASEDYPKQSYENQQKCPSPCVSQIKKQTQFQSCPDPCSKEISKINQRLKFIQDMISGKTQRGTKNGILQPYDYLNRPFNRGNLDVSPADKRSEQKTDRYWYSHYGSFDMDFDPFETIDEQPSFRKPKRN